MTHPLAQLLLNPFAGAAGLNLFSLGFYFTLALLAFAVLIESINATNNKL